MLNIGDRIGPYEVQSLLGEGGMAAVYKVWHSELHRYEALKMPFQQIADNEFAQRFLREARNSATFHHPHIVAIYNIYAGPQPYFTMELVNGKDLTDLIFKHGKLPLADTCAILRQVADALDYTHSHHILHRDIKPANILLEHTSTGGYWAKVVDFGISRAAEQNEGTRLTKTGIFIGTPEYMSPEQAGSGAAIENATDQYSLGIIAYEMLCGEPPFKSQSATSMITVLINHVRDNPQPPCELVPSLPRHANNAILKALSKNPQDRFPSCNAFITALEGTSSAMITGNSVSDISASPTKIPVPATVGYAPYTPPTTMAPFPPANIGQENSDPFQNAMAAEAKSNQNAANNFSGNVADKSAAKSTFSEITILRILVAVLIIGILLILMAFVFRKPKPMPPNYAQNNTQHDKSNLDKSTLDTKTNKNKAATEGTITPNNDEQDVDKDANKNALSLPTHVYKVINVSDDARYYGQTINGRIDGAGTLKWRKHEQKEKNWTVDKVQKVLSQWREADERAAAANAKSREPRNIIKSKPDIKSHPARKRNTAPQASKPLSKPKKPVPKPLKHPSKSASGNTPQRKPPTKQAAPPINRTKPGVPPPVKGL